MDFETLGRIVLCAYVLAALFVAVCSVLYACSDEYEAGDWQAMVFSAIFPGMNWIASIILVDEFLEDHWQAWAEWDIADRTIMAASAVTLVAVIGLVVL